jgi:hypothetical protein
MATFNEDLNLSEATKTRHFFQSNYLDFPILLTPRIEFLSQYTLFLRGDLPATGRQHRGIQSLIRTRGNSNQLTPLDPDEYPRLFRWNPPEPVSSVSVSHNHARKMMRDAIKGLKVTLGLGAGTTDFDTILEPTELEVRAYERWNYWDDIVNLPAQQFMDRGQDDRVYITVQVQNHRYFTNGRVVVGDTGRGNPLSDRVITWEQLVMIKDALYSRAQVLTAVRVLYKQSRPLTGAILALQLWHEECLLRHSNKGYEILKNSESLSKAYLSVISKDLFGADGPYGRMVEKIRQKERDLGTTSGFLSEKFSQVMERCVSTQDVVEIFGLLKISGHPLIDPYLGGRSASEIAREPDKTLRSDALRVDAMFKKRFTETYIRKNNRWPEISFVSKDVGKRLQEYRAMNYLGGHRMNCPLSDWNNVKFNRIFEFDYSPNFLELIDDKAICQYRSNIASNWVKDIPQTSHRRLLIQMINSEEIDLKSIVHTVMRREVPLDWLIVALHPKEREFKLAPRMFSMMVMEMRLFFALTEMNLADQVFPYVESLTMTMSRNQVMKRFLDLTTPPSGDVMRVLFLEIDLSRWNLRWRKLIIHMIGDTLDDMFGTPGIYTYVHLFFEQCMIVVRVTGLCPTGITDADPPESELLWYNHKGGQEGIVQKHWSLPTTFALDLAMDGTGYYYRSTGQGDNQIVTVNYAHEEGVDEQEEAKRIRDLLLKRISSEYEKIGQVVKPEECLESCTVITYSKDIYVRGLYYPTALKFHSRLFPHAAQDFPSVRSNIGAIMAGATAGAERCEQPLGSLYLAIFQSRMYLENLKRGTQPYGRWLASQPISDWNLFCEYLLMLPSDLGGFPVAGCYDFLYKGGSDPLTKSVASLLIYQRGENRLADRLLRQLSDDWLYDPEPAPLSIIRDPYSVPFKKPVTPIDGISKQTMDALKPKFLNRHLQQLVSTEADSHIESLICNLAIMKPFNPLIAHDILDCSLFGILDTMSKMFVATRTLQGVARSYDGTIVDRMIALEKDGILYQIKRLNLLPSSPWYPTTAYTTVENLRRRWNPSGCIPEGLTTHHPVDCTVEIGRSSSQQEGLHACVVGGKQHAYTTRGIYDPYLGSKTREKRSEHGYRIIGSDTTSRAFRKLQLISSQAGSNQKFRALIDLVGLTRSNTVLSHVSDLLPQIAGGTISHRYAARVGHQEAHCTGSPNFLTNCLISADRAGKLSGGVVDYPVMFQEYFLLGLSSLNLFKDEWINSLVWLTDELNLVPLPSLDITIEDPVDMTIPQIQGNPLAYLETIRLQRVRGIARHRSFIPRDWARMPVLRKAEKVAILEAYFRDTIKESYQEKGALDNPGALTVTRELDVMEVEGAGLDVLVNAAANVMADSALVTYTRVHVQHRTRWRIEAMLVKTGYLLASSFGRHLNHPRIRDDQYVQKNALFVHPRYSVHQSPANKLAALLTHKAADLVLGLGEAYCLRSAAITVAEPPMATAGVVSDYLTRVLKGMSARGQMTDAEFTHLYSKFILRIQRTPTTEEDKIRMLVASISTIVRWAQASNRYYLASEVERIITGGITHYSTSSLELCRLMRGTRDHTMTLRSREIKTVAIPTIHMEKRSQRSYEIIPTSVGEPDDAALLRRIASHKGLGSSMKDEALWAGMTSVFKDRSVLSVGVGPGVIGAIALTCGATFVYGLDLYHQTYLLPHQYINYVPPEILKINGGNQYLHLPEGITSSGNWLDNTISSSVLASIPETSTVVIDIETGEHHQAFQCLYPLLSKAWQGAVVLRTQMTIDYTEWLCGKLRGSGVNPTFYSAGAHSGAYLQVAVLLPSAEHYHDSENILSSYAIVSYHSWNPSLIREDPDKDIQALTRAALEVYIPSEGDSSLEVYQGLAGILRRVKGSYESRPGYAWWTSLLTACALYYWVVEMNGDPSVLLRWSRRRKVRIRVGGISIDVDWYPWKTRFLATEGSRILRN